MLTINFGKHNNDLQWHVCVQYFSHIARSLKYFPMITTTLQLFVICSTYVRRSIKVMC